MIPRRSAHRKPRSRNGNPQDRRRRAASAALCLRSPRAGHLPKKGFGTAIASKHELADHREQTTGGGPIIIVVGATDPERVAQGDLPQLGCVQDHREAVHLKGPANDEPRALTNGISTQ